MHTVSLTLGDYRYCNTPQSYYMTVLDLGCHPLEVPSYSTVGQRWGYKDCSKEVIHHKHCGKEVIHHKHSSRGYSLNNQSGVKIIIVEQSSVQLICSQRGRRGKREGGGGEEGKEGGEEKEGRGRRKGEEAWGTREKLNSCLQCEGWNALFIHKTTDMTKLLSISCALAILQVIGKAHGARTHPIDTRIHVLITKSCPRSCRGSRTFTAWATESQSRKLTEGGISNS